MFHRAVAPGIEIRALGEPDAPLLFHVADCNRQHLRTWLPWVDQTHSPDDVRAFIRSVADRIESGDELHAAIWVDGDIAGAIGHHAIDWPNRSCSLGYWISREHEGRGIVTRCCHRMLDYLFDERGLHRVEIRCGTGNQRSAAIPQRLGFRQDGVLRQAQRVNQTWIDLMVWSMLENEWRKG
jgi:ribosomal-protein-serine acetyltransferase